MCFYCCLALLLKTEPVKLSSLQGPLKGKCENNRFILHERLYILRQLSTSLMVKTAQHPDEQTIDLPHWPYSIVEFVASNEPQACTSFEYVVTNRRKCLCKTQIPAFFSWRHQVFADLWSTGTSTPLWKSMEDNGWVAPGDSKLLLSCLNLNRKLQFLASPNENVALAMFYTWNLTQMS